MSRSAEPVYYRPRPASKIGSLAVRYDYDYVIGAALPLGHQPRFKGLRALGVFLTESAVMGA